MVVATFVVFLSLPSDARSLQEPSAALPCPGAPPPFDRPALDPSQEPPRDSEWVWAGEQVPLGIGHLVSDDPQGVWDWWLKVRLPLSSAPGEEPWSWLINGWLVDVDTDPPSSRAVGSSGMIETSYEQMSLLVEENKGDWLRVRYARPGDSSDGTAWVPGCWLRENQLRFESWQERFASGQISPLFFRSRVPHALRTEPGADHERILWIGGDYHLEPLEFRGGWMRVRVVQPSNYCASDDLKVTVHEGWIQWRSPERGPWVWYYTRGC